MTAGNKEHLKLPLSPNMFYLIVCRLTKDEIIVDERSLGLRTNQSD